MPQRDELDEPVLYSARDSMRMDLVAQKVYLFGAGHVTYGEIDLKADFIEFAFGSKVVSATYLTDSLGNPTGKPEFTDGKETFTADRINYNFDSKKGIIRNVRTEVSEGFIDAERVKKDSTNTLFIADGSFCPCEDPDADTRFRIKKMKVMDELIVTGAGYLEIGGIPTPLAFPFGFFPNKKKQAAGLIIPTYGESPQLGFFLQRGGYYIPVNDHFDTQITGDIYSRGSWGLHNNSRYKVRYKYTGQFDVSYTVLKNSDPDFPDFSKKSTFFIKWNHAQDPKARPGSSFRANVNLGSVDNFQNTFSATVNDYLTNTFNSSISWSKSFSGTPFSIALNGRHNQNSSNRQVSVTLPEVSLNMNRIYPLEGLFKTKGSKKWFEKIGLTARTDATNQVTAGDTLYSFNRLNELASQVRNGIRNSATMNTSLKLLKGKFTLNPSVNYINRLYLERISKILDNTTNQGINDTIKGFFANHEVAVNASLGTQLYGYYNFIGKKFPIKVIRHVMLPNLSFSYRPQMNQNESYTDTLGRVIEYSPFQIGVYGAPSTQGSGLLSLNLINTLDMKVKPRSDTATSLKKVNLIENFTVNTSYDIFRDSLRFSDITLSGRTLLFKTLNINFTAALDPYHYVNGARVDQSLLNATGKISRLTRANVAAGFRLKSKKKTTGTNRPQDADALLEGAQVDEEDDAATAAEKAIVRANPDAFINFSIPWTLSVTHNLNINRSFFLINDVFRDSAVVTQTVNVMGDLSLTEKWKIGFTTGYDFTQKDFSITSISVYRDLNCWEMSFDWIPFGFRRSYSITINLKSALLKDLRLQRRRSWFDNGF